LMGFVAWRQLSALAAFTYYYTGLDIFAQPGFDLARSVPAKNMELLGRIGGKLHTIAIKDKRAFVGYGTEFVVLDISDPTRIKKVGSTNLLGLIYDIKLSGNCAY